MNRKAKDFLDKKMQVKLPENLSKDNILDDIDSSKAEIIEIPKKKNMAKKLVPLVASLFLVIGIIGVYMSSQQKDVPLQNNSGDKTEVMQYQSYDKIYEKFDTLHKEYKKNKFWDVFLYVDEEIAEGDMVATDDGADMAVPEAAPETMNGSSSSATGATSDNKDYGTTNRQEKDVDEGDIIKTDGNYLYIANADSNKSISIVDVTGEKMAEASQIDLKDNEVAEEIYIVDDKLVVVGRLQKEIMTNGNKYSRYEIATDCIGYVESDTFVKVYDISDRKAPKLVNEYSQQGGYNNSRMIGTKLYAISTYNVNVYNDDYRDGCIPEITVDDTCEKIPADSIYLIEESKSTTYAVITTLDVSEKKEPESTAILGNCGNLYASSKGLFLCEGANDEKYQEITKIYRFEYTDSGVKHMAEGKVNGYINDQFSMSYDGKYFRIATTFNKTTVDGDSVSMSVDDRVNNLYILNNSMQIVGKVEDLAKGELIKSVRFVGNMAYVVTFRQTDPLFVIDLNDPENPTVKGELKIPGFSEYLHPITENLLVGVGRDGTMTGENGDCKVSLFDVSNPYEPKESSVLKITQGAYCYSQISYNHKVYITLSENEFAVPFTVDYYVNNGDIKPSGDYYIRYKITADGLCEVARYQVGNRDLWIMGATYVENTFYVVVNNYDKGTYVKAYDLTTNEEIDSLQTAKWE